jgi:hypothetical protein
MKLLSLIAVCLFCYCFSDNPYCSHTQSVWERYFTSISLLISLVWQASFGTVRMRKLMLFHTGVLAYRFKEEKDRWNIYTEMVAHLYILQIQPFILFKSFHSCIVLCLNTECTVNVLGNVNIDTEQVENDMLSVGICRLIFQFKCHCWRSFWFNYFCKELGYLSLYRNWATGQMTRVWFQLM